ncbi:MAG: leucine-rich repeat domain-containing protein [Lachnospiraceae bacterium]
MGEKAFNNCTSLTIITIPSKVKKIGKKAFYQCKNLQYILVKTKKLKPGNIGAGVFGNGYSNPRVKLDKSVWKQYQNVFISKGLSSKALFLINPAKLVV